MTDKDKDALKSLWHVRSLPYVLLQVGDSMAEA